MRCFFSCCSPTHQLQNCRTTPTKLAQTQRIRTHQMLGESMLMFADVACLCTSKRISRQAQAIPVRKRLEVACAKQPRARGRDTRPARPAPSEASEASSCTRARLRAGRELAPRELEAVAIAKKLGAPGALKTGAPRICPEWSGGVWSVWSTANVSISCGHCGLGA